MFGTNLPLPTKTMNHTEYPKRIRKYTDDVLRNIIRECQEVIALQSGFNGNCGYYADEISYCSMELKRREQKRGNVVELIRVGQPFPRTVVPAAGDKLLDKYGKIFGTWFYEIERADGTIAWVDGLHADIIKKNNEGGN